MNALKVFRRGCVRDNIILQVVSLPKLHQIRCSNNSNDIPEPPDPSLCCMSGCANCVWLEYAKTLKHYCQDNNEDILNDALAKIEDPSFRLFIKMEVKNVLKRND